MKQRFTSKQTSINSTKAPAVYSMKRAVDVMTGKTVVDIGGGRFDTAAEAARGDVVRLAATKAAALLITVYEGDGSGTDRQPPTVGKKTGAPLIIWTKSPPLFRVGTLPGLVV